MIKVYNNFLSAKDQKTLQDSILNEFFPWFFNPYLTTPSSTVDDHYQFTHILYQKNSINSNYFELIKPFLIQLKVSAIRRIKCNLTLRNDKIMIYGMHRDYDNNLENSKTAIYYVNSSDGKTIFENGKEIKGVKNRLVMFPTAVKHSGTTHTNCKARAIINFNWY